MNFYFFDKFFDDYSTTIISANYKREKKRLKYTAFENHQIQGVSTSFGFFFSFRDV